MPVMVKTDKWVGQENELFIMRQQEGIGRRDGWRNYSQDMLVNAFDEGARYAVLVGHSDYWVGFTYLYGA